MHPLEFTHLSFVRSRTGIRHDKTVLLWMKQCWTVAPSLDPAPTGTTTKMMRREHYEQFYRRLLEAMTVEWDDEVWTDIVNDMWARDAGAFDMIDFNRFCCSIFSFAEMWIDALELTEYVRVLKLMYHVSSSTRTDETTIARRSNPSTLNAFLIELRQQWHLVQENVSLGKSVSFDPEHFVEAFGSNIPLIEPSDRAGPQLNRRGRRATCTKILPRIHADSFIPRPRSRSALVRVDESSNQRLDKPVTPSQALLSLSVRPRTTTTVAKRRQLII